MQTDQSHFWLIESDGIAPHLLVAHCKKEGEDAAIKLEIFDADGHSANRAQIEFQQNVVGLLELSPYLSTMKLQAGLRHGLLTVNHPLGMSLLLRLSNRDRSTLVQAGSVITRSAPRALPVHVQENRMSCLSLVNIDDRPTSVRAKIMLGKRSPELMFELAPRESRVIDLIGECAREIGEEARLLSGRGYVRVTTNSSRGLIGSILTVVNDNDGHEHFHIHSLGLPKIVFSKQEGV